ncbi:hypothetical protein [Leptotrichia sp. oral taxon 847]|uniref:hypothetical protein n=1 Tax=Leptotrichia sp. oral taxon 847 TaxID=1785996 RepID=UPI0007682356|nr:hypothetical protein [Leptotrichia sp. oral taxon 847]AMD95479.1 hypothetical protein AXF11_07760 [Leptotrichia sp. oral taxon 847]
MKKIKLVLMLSILVGVINSCTAVALGAGAVAGGYTCTKTNICKDLINKKNNTRNIQSTQPKPKSSGTNESGL